VVHSDTPSGVLNPVEQICPLLKEYGILTVVDSVTGMFAEPLDVDKAEIDIACGGSQKALSAPPGLTMVSVSEDAFAAMHNRRSPIRSFYANLLQFETYYQDKWFPYTMPVSDILGLHQALVEAAHQPERILRHERIAGATRKALTEAGLKLYLESGYASSVTVFYVPEGLDSQEILTHMVRDHHIMIAGCFDVLAGKVLRIGHMGNNANEGDVEETLTALGKTLGLLGFSCKADMGEVFRREMKKVY
jgi:aspartate aminotransferase-like enzyme